MNDTCTREDELLDALSRGFVGDELASHVAACAACSELRLVAGALLDDRAAAMHDAPVPASGAMWWRMRVRSRQEAEKRGRRSLLIGQAATIAIALALVFAFFGPTFAAAAQRLTSVYLGSPMFVAVAAWILIAPIAGWVAIRQK